MDLNAIKKKLDNLQQQNQRPSGGGRKMVFWRPSVGKQVIRVVPSQFDKANPFSEIYFHYGIGDRPIISQLTGVKKIRL